MKKLLMVLVLVLVTTQIIAQSEPWNRISPSPIETNLYEIIQIPGSDRIISIGSRASIMYSDDMGENWNVTYKPNGISRFTSLNAVHFVDSYIGYIAGSNSTLLKTVDGGTNWMLIPLSGDQNISDLFFHNELFGSILKPGFLFTTKDGCQTWDSIPIYGSSLQYINDSIGYIGRSGVSNYYKTKNAGNSWELIEITPAIDNFKITSIEFIDEEIGIIGGRISSSSSVDYYILKTIDGGISWYEVYTDYWNSISDIFFLNDSIGLTVGSRIMYDNMILRTEDGGSSWVECDMPFTYWSLYDIMLKEDGKGFCVGKYGQYLESNDFGTTWEIAYEKVCRANINTTEKVNDSLLFIGVENLASGGVPSGDIYKSTNRGETWSKININPVVTSICFTNDSTGYYTGDNHGYIYKTVNQGQSWSAYELEEWFRSDIVYFINEQIGFVGGEGDISGCYKTVDGGNSWYPIIGSFKPNYITDYAFVNDSIGWAIMDDCCILRTTNQGETWELWDDLGYYSYKKMKFFTDSIGFIIGNFMFKTVDGGNNWDTITDGLQGYYWMTDIEFSTTDTGYLTVDDREITLLRTTDGGSSWTPLNFPCTSTASCVSFFDANEGLVMGENGIIFKTYSGGTVEVHELPKDIVKSPILECFPNPTNSVLSVNLRVINGLNPNKILIYSSSGILQLDFDICNTLEIHKLDVSKLRNGIYFIASLSNNTILETNKIIVLH